MKLREFLSNLSYGELSNTSIGDSGSGTIKDKYIPTVISHINYGITDLCSRFMLHEKSVVIEMHEQIGTYILDGKYAQSSDSGEPIKYIIDSPYEPFDDDVLRIHKVHNEIGNELNFNDNSFHCSLKKVGHNGIQILQPVDGNVIFVTYLANQKKISLDANPDTTNIDLPAYLLEALSFYVAARLFSNMNNQILSAKAQEFMARYENSCEQVEQRNLNNEHQDDTNIKSEIRGWL